MSNISNEKREELAIDAAKLATPTGWEVLPYETLIPPYPVWAAMFACGVPRTRNAYKTTASGLLQDEYEACIDLNEKALLSYFKTSALLPPAAGQIKFSIIQRNNIKAFV